MRTVTGHPRPRQPISHSKETFMARTVSLPVRFPFALLVAVSFTSACARNTPEGDVHAEHAATATVPAAMTPVASDPPLPASAVDVAARLARSPRHGEWAMIRTGPSDSVKAWIVYPERSTKAPVVV